MKKLSFFSFLFIACLFNCVCFLYAQELNERVLSFKSLIEVDYDASMIVTETISVHCAHKKINYGIYRDFPLRYRDMIGNRYSVGFEILRVQKDGLPEKYHLKNTSNGVRIYIGNEQELLSAGEHVYTLRYKTNRQLGFFKDFDELYWNVTGNDWEFPIEKAQGTVILPKGAQDKILNAEAYTGFKGSKEQAFTVSRDVQGYAHFAATRPLKTGEGFTIVVSWPKGYVKEPDLEEKVKFFIFDHKGALAGGVGLVFLLLYYLFMWSRFGRDPAKGTIIPLYEPPRGFSSACARYISRMCYDDKIFAAAVIEMAVKGYLTIHEQSGGYVLEKTGAKQNDLSPEERVIAKNLFSASNQIELTSANHLKISAAKTELQNALKRSFEKIYFFTNKNLFLPGIVFSMLIVVASALLEAGSRFPIVIFMSVWLTIWSLGVTALFMNAVSLWRIALNSNTRKTLTFPAAAGMTLFSLPFFAGEIFGLSILVGATSLAVLGVLILAVFLDVLFYHLLKRPTFEGRRLMDKMEGFKMFLGVTEKDRLKHLTSFEKTPELFEKYLPYALALDVEEAWARQFVDVFKRVEMGSKAYHPSWYDGRAFGSFGVVGFASTFGGSFSGIISSSSHAPGSSSGSGGCGSSGGGGGGGGGGGW